MATTPKNQAKPEVEKTATFVVASPILFNAATERAEIGDEIELTEAQAVSYGQAVKAKAKPKAEDAKT